MTIEKLNSSDQFYTAYMQVNPLRDPDEGMFPFTYWLSYAYDWTDVDDTSKLSIDVPPGAIVLRVIHQVATAFDAVLTATVGDGDTADGWMATGIIDPDAAGNTVLDYDATFVQTAKRYADGDTIDITFGTLAYITQGSGKIFVEVLSYFEDLADD